MVIHTCLQAFLNTFFHFLSSEHITSTFGPFLARNVALQVKRREEMNEILRNVQTCACHHYNRLQSFQIPIINLGSHILRKQAIFSQVLSILKQKWRYTGLSKRVNEDKSLETRHVWTTIIIENPFQPWIPHFNINRRFWSILVYFGPEMEDHGSREENKLMNIIGNVLRLVFSTNLTNFSIFTPFCLKNEHFTRNSV